MATTSQTEEAFEALEAFEHRSWCAAVEAARARLAKLSVRDLRILAKHFGWAMTDADECRKGDLIYELADRLVAHEEGY